MKTFLVACFFFPIMVFGQKSHTVGPKETLFSIGRKYQVHPRELATFNQIPFESGLTVGQVLKIPSKKSMAPLASESPNQSDQKPVNPLQKKEYETVPLYHTVAKKETLFQISKKTKASIPDLKKWNHLTGDALKEGMQLVIGHKKELKKAASVAVATKEEPVTEPSKVVSDIPKTVVEPVAEKPITAIPVPESKKPEQPVTTQSEPVKAAPLTEQVALYSGEGFFKPAYEEQVTGKATLKDKTGQAGSFKSGSGWQDGKYYCLYNQAAPGTIIKVTNGSNQKSIYVKVLDVIPDMKQNEGLLILISNSGAALLGAADSRFDCSITY